MASSRPWGGIEYGLSGGRDVRDNLRQIASAFPQVAVAAVGEELAIEVGEVRRATPFDTDPRSGQRGGDLRESVRVIGPELEGDTIVAAIAAGGEDVGVEYAIGQHEIRRFQHDEGQSKYIEDTLDESSRFMTARLVSNIQRRVSTEVLRG